MFCGVITCQAAMDMKEFLQNHQRQCLVKTALCPNGCGQEISSAEFFADKTRHYNAC